MQTNRRQWLVTMAALPVALSLTRTARAAGTLEAVKSRGALRVGVTQAPPWFSKDPRSGEWASGVGVSLGKALAEKLGVRFEPVEVTWGTAIAALQADRIDMMAMMDATPERREAAAFPETPLLYYSMAILARDDLDVKAWADLDKASVRIAVPQASSMDRFVSGAAGNANIQRFPGNAEAIAAFQSNRVDAVCLFHPPLLAARQRLGRGRIIVPTPVQSQPSSIALRKGDDAFVSYIDQAIGEYYRSGQTQAWYEEFLRGFGLDPASAPPVMRERL